MTKYIDIFYSLSRQSITVSVIQWAFKYVNHFVQNFKTKKMYIPKKMALETAATPKLF